MRYGYVIPSGDPRTVVDLAVQAEKAGWDGVFYWDGSHFDPPQPVYDAWVVLAAIAARTERVRLGAIVFALPRRRPWEVAREAVALDHLSGGRLILPVGLGAVEAHHPARFGLPEERATRAELLDESLDILNGLWSGEPFSYQGKHYQLENVTFQPPPVQRPRVPIWVIGAWKRERSLARVLKYDGLLPNKIGEDGRAGPCSPDDLRAIRAYVTERRDVAGFDLVAEGKTPADDPAAAAAIVQPWVDAGATWWTEADWDAMNDLPRVRARIEAGPPRVD
jgi:hypothetical protein